MTNTLDRDHITLAIAALVLFGVIYDRLVVDRIERLHPSIGVTAWEVVGGVTVTLLVFGLLAGAEMMLLALLCFAASGIPMIIGSHERHMARSQERDEAND